MLYGYARVSTREQNEVRQIMALKDAGVRGEDIFIDKQSGKDFMREGYNALMDKLDKGDGIVIKSLDRLGRNYDEILKEWRQITRDKGADIIILDMPLLDTRNSKDLTGTLISDIVLQLLSYVAHKERDLIKQRQAEGIAAAKERGVRFGRKPMEKPAEYESLKKQCEQKNISARAAAKRLGITHRTFLKWVKEPEESGYESIL